MTETNHKAQKQRRRRDRPHKPLPAASVRASIGTTGLKQQGGFINEEWNTQLVGNKGIRLLREMWDNSPIIGATMNATASYIRGVDWKAAPLRDGGILHPRGAAFVESVRDDMSHTFSDMTAESLSMLIFGWALFEKVFKRRLGSHPGFLPNGHEIPKSKFDDGLWGLHKIAIRSQDSLDRWEFNADGTLRGMWQNAEFPDGRSDSVFIPIEKAILFRTQQHKDNPEGRPHGRSAVRSYLYQLRLEEIEGVGLERHMSGLPAMFVPPEMLGDDADPLDKTAVESHQKLMAQIRKDERQGIVLPAEEDREGVTGYKFKLMSSESQPMDMGPIIDRKKTEQAQVFLADWLMLGTTGVGSWALSSDKTRMYAQTIGAILHIMADTYHRSCTEQLFRLNGFPQEQWARLLPGDIEKQEMLNWANYVSTLVNTGVLIPDDALESQARRLGSIEETRTTNDSETPRPTPQPTQAAKGVNSPEGFRRLFQILNEMKAGTMDRSTAEMVIAREFDYSLPDASAIIDAQG